MPLYEYRCKRCGETFEIIQKFSDQALSRHEECGGELEKLVSASALQFKGSGWYINDYARGGKSSSGESSKEKPSQTETKGEGSNGKPSQTETKGEGSSGKPPKTETKSETK
ncbi:MAG: zinc ribbon domain-containing protein [Bryobacteraceae bacterium]|jgi:putative FmdB family regulatory protein